MTHKRWNLVLRRKLRNDANEKFNLTLRRRKTKICAQFLQKKKRKVLVYNAELKIDEKCFSHTFLDEKLAGKPTEGLSFSRVKLNLDSSLKSSVEKQKVANLSSGFVREF